MPSLPWEQLWLDPMRIPREDLTESFDHGALAEKGGERSLSSFDPVFANQMMFEVLRVARKGELILSVGCGNGEVEARIQRAGGRILALDMRAVHAHVPWVQADAHALPLRARTCGTVLFSESIGQVNPERAVAEAARVLVPGGFLVISTYHLEETDGKRGIPYPWGGSVSHPSTRKQIEAAVQYWNKAMYRLYPDGLLCTFLQNAGFHIWHKSVHCYKVGDLGYTDMLILIGQFGESTPPVPPPPPAP